MSRTGSTYVCMYVCKYVCVCACVFTYVRVTGGRGVVSFGRGSLVLTAACEGFEVDAGSESDFWRFLDRSGGVSQRSGGVSGSFSDATWVPKCHFWHVFRAIFRECVSGAIFHRFQESPKAKNSNLLQ